MNILIIGGTGFVGKAVATHLAALGHAVTLFNRGLTPSTALFPSIVGDVDRLPEYAAALRLNKPDVVIHAIAYTEQHAFDVVEVFRDTGTRLVGLSSGDCYEAFYQLNQGQDRAELPIAEGSPLCAQRHYWAGRPGAKSYPDYDKNLVTNVLMEAHRKGEITASVLRLPLVFGPGDFQFRHRHGKIIRRLYDQHSTLLMGAVEQASVFSFGYVDNVAAAIAHAALNTSADGGIYNVGEINSRSMRRWAQLYSDAANSDMTISIVPDALLEGDLDALDCSPRLLLFDSQAFSRATGFIDPVPLSEQVQRTLAWGLSHPEALPPQPNYAAEADLLGKYAAFIRTTLAELALTEARG